MPENGIFGAETKRLRKGQGHRGRDDVSLNNPANSGLVAEKPGNLHWNESAWWAREDSNLQPSGYERGVVSEKSSIYRPFRAHSHASVHVCSRRFIGQPLVSDGRHGCARNSRIALGALTRAPASAAVLECHASRAINLTMESARECRPISWLRLIAPALREAGIDPLLDFRPFGVVDHVAADFDPLGLVVEGDLDELAGGDKLPSDRPRRSFEQPLF